MLDKETVSIWTKLIKGNYDINIPTFLISSLLPYSEVLIDGGDGIVAVNIKDLKSTGGSIIGEGIKLLISSGVAREDNGYLVIGYSPRLRETRLFLLDNNELSSTKTKVTTFSKTTGGKSLTETTKIFDFSDLLEELTPLLDRYKKFSETVGQPGSYNIIKDKLNSIITKGESGKITGGDLIAYLNCINSLVYEWSMVPTQNSTNSKYLACAKSILTQYSLDKVLEVIPYFVENYPKIASKGWEDTNVFTLKTHFNKMYLAKTQTTTKVKRTQYVEEDRL